MDSSRTLLTQDLQAAVESLVLLPSDPASSGTVDETHDYAEIYTPSRERMPWLGAGSSSLANHRDVSQGGSTSSTNSGGSLSLDCAGKPPTPPLHRFPSWESRIYQVAADGLQVVQSGGAADTANNNNNNSVKQSSGSGSAQGYCDISVPVYATVKGRASQIRSMPFTGDSSDDSSDGEGGGTTGGEHNNHGGESNLHHHHHHHHHHPGSAAGNTAASTNVTNTRTTNSSSDNTDTSLSTGGSGSSPSKSMKTTSSLSPAKRSSSGSPSKSMKRGVLYCMSYIASLVCGADSCRQEYWI
ncbi:Uncharacterized protein C0J52_24802 [Blattella germanica]|nr:Uncharacterized protein C0J52_24802 [Blattella germanica]